MVPPRWDLAPLSAVVVAVVAVVAAAVALLVVVVVLAHHQPCIYPRLLKEHKEQKEHG